MPIILSADIQCVSSFFFYVVVVERQVAIVSPKIIWQSSQQIKWLLAKLEQAKEKSKFHAILGRSSV